MTNLIQDLTHAELETPESRCDFILHHTDGELVMLKECPEFGGAGGRRWEVVKAVEDNRSPSPGGHSNGPSLDFHGKEFG